MAAVSKPSNSTTRKHIRKTRQRTASTGWLSETGCGRSVGEVLESDMLRLFRRRVTGPRQDSGGIGRCQDGRWTLAPTAGHGPARSPAGWTGTRYGSDSLTRACLSETGGAGDHLTVARCLRRLRMLWFRRESLPISDIPGVCIIRLSASRHAVGKASRQIPRKLPGCCRLPSTAPRPHRESSRRPDINARCGTKWNCPRNCRHGACPLRTTGPRFGSGKARIGDEVPVRRPAKASCCSWPAGCPEQ